jgi:prophage tail gpP-like protein
MALAEWSFGPSDCIAVLSSQGGDSEFKDYESYTITSDLLEPSDSFEFRKPAPRASDGTRSTIEHRSITMAMPIELNVTTAKGRALQCKGRIYRTGIEVSQSNGTEYHLNGYDHMRPLVDSDMMPGLVFTGCTFREVILKTLAPFGFTEADVIIDNTANRNFLIGRGSTTTQVLDPAQAFQQKLIAGNASAIAEVRAAGGGGVAGDYLLAAAQKAARAALHGSLVSTASVAPLTVGPSPTSTTSFDSVTGDTTVVSPGVWVRDVATGAFTPASAAGLDIPPGTTYITPEKLRYTAVSTLNTLPIDKAKPHAGESVYAFLHRHAIRFNLLIWGTADGKIVFGKPNYDQAPIYNIVCRQGDTSPQNNAESISRVENIEHRPSEIHVYGHSVGGDFARSPIHSVVFDPFIQAMGLYRPITIHDNSARTKEDADQRANYELCMRRQTADVVKVTMKGHAQNGYVFAIDTVANVDWPAGGISGPMYVIRRTFTRSKEQGTHTILDLVPLNSIVLGPPSDASVNE